MAHGQANSFLVSLFTQSILYGIYVATFVSSLRWLLYEDEGWKLRKKVVRPILIVTLLVFACLTTYLSISFRITFFVLFGRPNSRVLACLLPMIGDIARIIADAVLMYRCWVVHARSWRVIALPIALWFSCLVAIGLFTESYVKTCPQPVQSVFLTTFISCHIANNIYGTSAIVYKIMRVAQTGSCTSRRLKRTGRTLVESGVLYTLSGVVNLIFQPNGYIRDTLPYMVCIVDVFNLSMTGITFNFIIIRSGQERANPRNDSVDTRFVEERLRQLSALK